VYLGRLREKWFCYTLCVDFVYVNVLFDNTYNLEVASLTVVLAFIIF
jgi:hypothetical protein